jgi:two-component system, cell cycle sensor histidine kinase and response regulator CckA
MTAAKDQMCFPIIEVVVSSAIPRAALFSLLLAQRSDTIRLGNRTLHFQIDLGLIWIPVILILCVLLAATFRLAMIARRRAQEAEAAKANLENEVTERARAEAALLRSEEQYRLLFDNNPQPMWVYDLETLRFLAVNNTAIQGYGYSREEFLGMTILDIRPAEEIPAVLKDVAKGETGIGQSEDWTHRRKDGTLMHAQITSHPILLAGRAARLVLSSDMSARKRLEDQLRHAQKMEAVGRLAGGVAHDFNNLLTIVIGYGGMLEASPDLHPSLQEMAAQINRAADRASGLTRQLLAFSRQQMMVPKVLDLNEVIGNIYRMLQRLIGEDVEISIVQARGLGRVKADPGQIEQVIVNLAVNSRDAMPGGCRLTLETANVDLDEAYARTHPGVSPGRYVMLAVTDTGSGVDEETRAHIFEPFFTTKEPGKGTGLGLSTVYGIVKQSGGNIWLYSEPGHGATFKIYLPMVERTPEDEESEEPERKRGEAPRGSETVLLVEDDPALRSFVRVVLGERGYRILEAQNGAEAISIAGQFDGRIDFVLTDVVMPKMGGRELAAELAARCPGIRILYMSGYTDDAVVLHELLEARMPYLQKPFTAEVLARKVREILDVRR